MYWRIRPPKHYTRGQLKMWYRRLHGRLPVNWYECPGLFVKPNNLPVVMTVLHQAHGSWPTVRLELKTYRP